MPMRWIWPCRLVHPRFRSRRGRFAPLRELKIHSVPILLNVVVASFPNTNLASTRTPYGKGTGYPRGEATQSRPKTVHSARNGDGRRNCMMLGVSNVNPQQGQEQCTTRVSSKLTVHMLPYGVVVTYRTREYL